MSIVSEVELSAFFTSTGTFWALAMTLVVDCPAVQIRRWGLGREQWRREVKEFRSPAIEG